MIACDCRELVGDDRARQRLYDATMMTRKGGVEIPGSWGLNPKKSALVSFERVFEVQF